MCVCVCVCVCVSAWREQVKMGESGGCTECGWLERDAGCEGLGKRREGGCKCTKCVCGQR